MTNEELWQAALGEIELSISKANFITWFKNTSILTNKNGRVVIGVPNGFSKEWLEIKYKNYILKALSNLNSEIKEIACVIHSPQNSNSAKTKTVDALKNTSPYKKIYSSSDSKDISFSQDEIYEESNLNPRYTFETFIVGENNDLARAACYAVTKNLGKVYNPLFIYGGVGLGKTHLLQSIGNETLKNDPSKKVRYISSEHFANDLVDSIKNQRIAQFKTGYQKFDLLIIDDIQFLSGKEKTQDEFFYIFNSLYQINKQIVISSDRPPKEISSLEERLRSRFEGGMIADVIKPDLETRMAILKAKSGDKDFFIEDEVIKFVAENIKNNIRELEGALNKIIASCELEKEDPSMNFVKNVLSGIISSNKKKGIQSKDIINLVANFYGIPINELINKGRRKEIALARQIAMYLIRSELDASYLGIGEQFSGRDHTTALHAYEKITNNLNVNEKLKEDVAALKDKLYRV